MAILKVCILDELRNDDGNFGAGNGVEVLFKKFLYHNIFVFSENNIVKLEVINGLVNLFIKYF